MAPWLMHQIRAFSDQMLHPAGPLSAHYSRPLGLTFAFAMRAHSFLRRLVGLLLAVLVLTASVGLTVQRHTCRISGRSRVEIAVPGQLAFRGYTGQLAPARPIAQDNCCDFSSHLHQLSAPALELVAKVLLPVPVFVAWQPAGIAWPVPPRAGALQIAAPRWFAADSSPPARGGRGLLAFACTLVV